MWSIVDVCTNGKKGCFFLCIYLKFRGVMEHPIGHFITPLHGEAKHPKEPHINDSYNTPKGVYETPLFLQCS